METLSKLTILFITDVADNNNDIYNHQTERIRPENLPLKLSTCKTKASKTMKKKQAFIKNY